MEDDFPSAHSMDTRWYAVDQAGHIAMFDSGENGHVPESAESDIDSEMFRDFWSRHHLGERQPELDDDWEERDKVAAEQLGVFYFSYSHDFDPIGTYELWVAPKAPLHVDQLPPELRGRWKKMRFDKVDFARISKLQPLEYEPCFYWYEEDRVAYLCSDGKTIRPIPGMEDRFANFCKQFREENAEVAKKYIFEGVNEDPK
jgi:hypothetical protein